MCGAIAFYTYVLVYMRNTTYLSQSLLEAAAEAVSKAGSFCANGFGAANFS